MMTGYRLQIYWVQIANLHFHTPKEQVLFIPFSSRVGDAQTFRRNMVISIFLKRFYLYHTGHIKNYNNVINK